MRWGSEKGRMLITPEIKAARKQWNWLTASRKRLNLIWGGASSSKSVTVGQHIVVNRFLPLRDIGILIVRKTRPAVKASCWEFITRMLEDMGLEQQLKINKSDLRISFEPNRSFMLFDGLDNIAKKKSIVGINYIWVEELAGLSTDTRITLDEWRLLDTICRNTPADGAVNQLYGTFNPVDPVGNRWLELLTKRGDTARMGLLHCTHGDNPFLDPEARNTIIALAEEDPEYGKIYNEGVWGIPLLVIYDNWDTVASMPEEFDTRIWGLDFGYSASEAALVEIRIRGREAWIDEHIYQTKLTNPDLIDLILAKGIIDNRNDMIVADRSRPEHIKEFRNAGFNIYPSETKRDDKKTMTSVQYGIDTVRRYRLHITQRSINTINEISTYKWKPDPEGNPLSEPLKFHDHSMDAMRYALAKIERHWTAGVGFAPDAAPKQQDPDYDPIDDDDLWTES